MSKKKNYIFTNKFHAKQGIMATILGVLSLISMLTAIYLSYRSQGQISANIAAAVILAVIYAFIGLVLGIYACGIKDNIKLFSVLGILLNVLAIAMLSMILYVGAYGL